MLWWTKWLTIAAGIVWVAVSVCGLAAADYVDDFFTPVGSTATGVGLLFLGGTLGPERARREGRRQRQRLLLGLAILLLVVGAVIILFRLGWLIYLDIYEPMNVYGRAP